MKNKRPAVSRRTAKTKAHAVYPGLLKRIQPDAAGIDCGATSHYVAVPEGRDPEPVREFRTSTGGLRW
jgi:transposase